MPNLTFSQSRGGEKKIWGVNLLDSVHDAHGVIAIGDRATIKERQVMPGDPFGCMSRRQPRQYSLSREEAQPVFDDCGERNDARMGQLHAFGWPGGARGIHDSCQVVG